MAGENITRVEAETRSAQIGNLEYDVFLDVTSALETGQAGENFESNTVIKFSYTSSEAGGIFIDLISNDLRSVTLNGQPLNVNEVFKNSRINLKASALQPENTVEIKAFCQFSNVGTGLHKSVSIDAEDEGEVYLYTQFEVPDARRMYACFEQPDLKAVFNFTVKTPVGWQITSTSPTPKPEIVDGGELYKFAPTPKMSTYLTSLCAGPFAVFEDSLTNLDGREIPLKILCRQSMAPYCDPENIFRCTKEGFKFYGELFNVAYPYEKYDQVFMPQFNAGAMENIGNVTYREDYIFRSKVSDALKERRVTTILHELAHMWFGDLVTMKWWNDLWLNESFAEYVSTLAGVEATDENENGWVGFNSREKAWGMDQDQLPSTHPIVANIKDLDDVLVNFDGITYAKGAAALQAMINYSGREAFFRGIENYLNKFAYSNATLDDLLLELEATTGKDLHAWSKFWLETAGINTLEPEFETDAGGRFSSFRVKQTAPEDLPTLRPHMIKIGLYDFDDGSTTPVDEQVKNITATGSLSLRGAKLKLVKQVQVDVLPETLTDVPELVGVAKPAAILLNDEGLTFAKTRLDETSVGNLMNYIHKVSDPLARGLMLNALWNMTRDAKLNPNSFIDLAFKAIAIETEATTLRQVLLQIETAVFLYLPAELRSQMIKGVGTRLWELAREATPGSDAQLQFFSAFCNFASTDDHISVLRNILSGEIKLPECEIDLNLKWEICGALARLGVADKARIIQEADSDKANRANLGAKFSIAAIPTREAKEAAFNLAYDKHSVLNNDEQVWVGRGFTEVIDPSLLDGFGAKYFEMVNEVWDNRDFKVAENLLELFYPARLANLELAQLGEKWLDENSRRPDALKRIISENVDRTRRALKVQKVAR